MENLRRYGEAPYNVVLAHGGPGAPGEMAPVARELSPSHGVLEPLQTQATLDGQVEELKAVVQYRGDPPVALVGYSWGAILGFVFTARNPDLVRKLILASSGVFARSYVERIKRNRLSRLSARERARMEELLEDLGDSSVADKDSSFAELGELISKADSYDPIPHDSDIIAYQRDIFESVWRDTEELRGSGELLEMGRSIACPVVAIHGDFDPHPRDGIKRPLAGVLRDFRFVQLEKCGHHPWYEKHARDEFYAVLKRELA